MMKRWQIPRKQLARHLATQPTFGLGLIKQAINSAETNTPDTQLDLERATISDLPDGAQIIVKVSVRSSSKRSPQFTGK